ncbi:MAG: DUF4136 domain-containing protein [Planctomycetota bacterium]
MRLVGTFLVAMIAAVALSGCSTQFKDITVETVADPQVDLKGYATYAWAAAAAVIRDPNREWTPVDLDVGAEITFLVDRELREKGYVEVAGSPDMLAIYAVGVDMMSLNVEFDEEHVARFEEVPKGGVAIVLADAETRRTIWIGAAVAELLEEPDRELAKQRLDHAISKMFKGFPG